MRKVLSFLLVAGILAACNNDGGENQNPVDSIEKRTDTLQKNVDSAIGEKIDSLEQRREELKEKFDSAAQKRIDSLKQKS